MVFYMKYFEGECFQKCSKSFASKVDLYNTAIKHIKITAHKSCSLFKNGLFNNTLRR